MNQQKPKKETKMETTRMYGETRCVIWLEEYTKNLVDESVPAHRDTPASSSRESASEPRGKVVSGKHNVYIHFPRDRNCNISMRTKITRALCRKRIGVAVLGAENLGDLITADHKVLREGCESRNNHRYAIVAQDLAPQRIQFYPCKTKTSQETEKSLQCFWSCLKGRTSFTLTINSSEFGKDCEDVSWNHCTSILRRSETNGIAERALWRIKEGTSAVLLRSGLDEKWWADSMECCCHLRNIQDPLSDAETPHERRFGVPFNGPVVPFGSMVQYHPVSAEDLSRLHEFGPEVLPGTFFGYALHAGGIWKGDILVADIEG